MNLFSGIAKPRVRAFIKVAMLIGVGPGIVFANPNVSFMELPGAGSVENWSSILEGLQRIAFVAAGLIVSGFQLRVRILDVLQKDYFNLQEFNHLEPLAASCTKRISSIMVWLVCTATLLATAPLLAYCLSSGFIICWICLVAFGWGIIDFLAILNSFDELEEFTLRSIQRHKKRVEVEALMKGLGESDDS